MRERNRPASSAGYAMAGLTLLLAAAPAAAVTIHVDRLDDGPAAPTHCTAAPGDCSLRQAVSRANGAGDDVIVVPAGVFRLTIAGAGEDGNATGDLDYTDTDELEILGGGPATTIVQQWAADRLLDLLPSAGPVLLRGLTLTGGRVQGNGGALRTEGASLALREMTLAHSEALTVSTSTGFGGCVAHDTGAGPGGTFTAEDTLFRNCVAGGSGGALFVSANGLDVRSCLRCRFENNSTGGSGGGLEAPGFGVWVIADSVFVGNTAERGGGGLAVQGTDLEIRRSAFVDNHAGQVAGSLGVGGALAVSAQRYLMGSPTPSDVLLENVTIARSTTSGLEQVGTGLYVEDSAVELRHVTVTDSRSPGGHSLFVRNEWTASASVGLRASIIDGGCLATDAATLTSLDFNVELPWDGSANTTCNLAGDEVVGQALDLKPVAVYGGPHGVPTQAPLPSSPARDLVPSAPGNACPGEDARTASRDNPCDAGAHDADGAAPGRWIFADGFESGDVLAWSAMTP